MPPKIGQRIKQKPTNIPRPIFPPHDRQVERIVPHFELLRKVMASDDSETFFQANPNGIAPERTLIFEVAGSIGNF
jgi:hypothetical protein